LYCRAIETESKNPIITDNKALDIVHQLDPQFIKSESKLYRSLAGREMHKKLSVTMSLRTRRFDDYVKDFIRKNNNAVVVNMGCGFDTRYSRVDDGRLLWYDLDFPEVIEAKEMFIQESERYHFIRSSVMDFTWMNGLPEAESHSFIFLAEGLFMYLKLEEVKNLVLELQWRFPGAELVCEITNKYWVAKLQKGHFKRKFQRKLHLSGDAVFQSGLSKSADMEEWSKGIEFLDEWTYFDEGEPKLGWFRLFKNIELLRRVQWAVHYRLN
jgi:methyltransferase (TIGR00027 family)